MVIRTREIAATFFFFCFRLFGFPFSFFKEKGLKHLKHFSDLDHTSNTYDLGFGYYTMIVRENIFYTFKKAEYLIL